MIMVQDIIKVVDHKIKQEISTFSAHNYETLQF